jgi:AcrR family transcriptional regulator
MARLTRSENRAVTRNRLLEIARQRFRRDGYAGTSIDGIAEEAGFSKGAVYSNFENKETLFLAAIEAEGRANLDDLYGEMDLASSTDAIIDAVARWADHRSRSGNWALAILEYARQPAADPQLLQRQEENFRTCWRELGARLAARCPNLAVDVDGEMLGALLHELAHAPVMAIIAHPTSGDLVRLALHGLLSAKPTTGYFSDKR